jgi:hypothetical protein
MLNWLKAQLSGPTNAPATARQSERNPPRAPRPHARRAARIDAEVVMIAERFSRPPYQGIYYDDEHRDWLIIPNYPLPTRFRERRCDLLIVFPGIYPETPPIGFYLNKKFALRDGSVDGHLTSRAYHQAPDLTEQGWHWYCVTMTMNVAGAWRPQADPQQPDNLWTFLNMVREVLTNDF